MSCKLFFIPANFVNVTSRTEGKTLEQEEGSGVGIKQI